MRTLILLAIFAAMSVSAGAAERITVEQLEQKLAALFAPPPADPASNGEAAAETDLLRQLSQGIDISQDTDRASQIDALELTERLTSGRLAKLSAKYKPGTPTELSLEQLADRSALLDPPASEIPAMAPPGLDSQREMVHAAGVFVFQVLSRLPNFFATRTTTRFDDGHFSASGALPPMERGLHLMGRSSREITFRDGKEVIDPMHSENLMPGIPEMGLESQGEFGPEPAIVLFDLARGTLTFHHWEQMPTGLAAVFRYSVPRGGSHYEVNYSCNASVSFNDSPGYHGSLAIDPATGAILRITLEADSKKGDPISHIASVIEYGPVAIGGREYICPVRSLAFMVEDANSCSTYSPKAKLLQPVTMLNQTTFTDYHRLGSTLHVIAEPDGASGATPAAPNP
jgi:hypothetical protein